MQHQAEEEDIDSNRSDPMGIDERPFAEPNECELRSPIENSN